MLSIFRFRRLVSCALFCGVMTAKLNKSKCCVFKNGFHDVTLFHLMKGTLSGETKEEQRVYVNSLKISSKRVAERTPKPGHPTSDLEFLCLSPTPLLIVEVTS